MVKKLSRELTSLQGGSTFNNSLSFEEKLLQILGSLRKRGIFFGGADGLDGLKNNIFLLLFEGNVQDIARRRWFVSKGTVALRYTRQLEQSFLR